MTIKQSELILNPDGSIYHLNLLPEHVAPIVITVGDPNRVHNVTNYFDDIEFTIQKREFHTQTGTYKGKRITVISTGIGTDNIDIALNELDALVNIDFKKRAIKPVFTPLNIIRIGTSGSIQKNIPINSFLISEYAVGFDSLLHFYDSEYIQHLKISEALKQHTKWFRSKSDPYVVKCSEQLLNIFVSTKTIVGFTATNSGFYGPQGRILRIPIQDYKLNEKLTSFNFQGRTITNFEMETAGIYGISNLLGHHAISMNAIIANRATGEFSDQPERTIDQLIKYTLDKIISEG